LSNAQVKISEIFAGEVADAENRFEGIETFKLITGSPMVKGGLGFFDCKVSEVYDFASNSLIIGEVITAEIGEESRPLQYFDQRYHQLQE